MSFIELFKAFSVPVFLGLLSGARKLSDCQ